MRNESEGVRAQLILLLGGVRSGKSARAVALAQSLAGTRGVMFVATAQPFDDEMRQRIAQHRAERPATWETLESPVELPGDIGLHLAMKPEGPGVIVIDCLTLWVSNILLLLDDGNDAEGVVAKRVDELRRTIANDSARNKDGGFSRRHWIIVSNEVGLGVVPPTSLGRRYRDALGRANQLIAAAADRVSLLVAGLEIALK